VTSLQYYGLGLENLSRNCYSRWQQSEHPDIRPRSDVTSNVLVKMDNENNSVIIKLIDYESLVLVENWKVFEMEDTVKENLTGMPQHLSGGSVFVWLRLA